MKIKDVIKRFAGNPPKLTVRTFITSDEPKETFVLLEGDPDALRFLGEAILALANSNSGCNWDLHPSGAGNIFFDKDSTVGIYLHRLPCEFHRDLKVR
jgi:hypothetical protein